MTWQSGGGGGIKGITPDGATPPGILVAGDVVAGDSTATIVPSIHGFIGATQFVDTIANGNDNDILVSIDQRAAIPVGGSPDSALYIRRRGNTTTDDYQGPTLGIVDLSGSGQNGLEVQKTTGAGVALLVKGKFASSNSGAHALGAYSGNALPVYDANNTLLGYIPIYA